MKYTGRKLLFFLIILIPFWSFLIWFFWPKETLKTLILDKTVLTNSGDEHRSLNWVLTHEKFTKPGGAQYDISDDYYGFFPIGRPEYQIKDLTPFSETGLDSMATYYDVGYFTDAYGIYQNEWYLGKDINERSKKVYGGLFNQDYAFMKRLYGQRKLLLSEFNIIASPTPIPVRDKVEGLLGIDFSGWTGRYYHSLDTIENPDIPKWMRRLHKAYYGEPFDFEDVPGIVLIHETNKIVVLEAEKHLEYEVPIINTPPIYQKKYEVPDYVRYPFWFDITFSQSPENVYATYKLNVKTKGDSALSFHHIPNEFPAVIGDSEENLKFYFCGDFSDNPIPFGLSYFKGVEYLRKLFYNNQDELDRKKFFWEYYRPMVTNILQDYVRSDKAGAIDRDTVRAIERYPGYVRFYKRYGYRRPSIGLEGDVAFNPNTIYGTEIRNSGLFNEESEYEDDEGNDVARDDEGRPAFLRDVEDAPTEEEAAENRKKDFEVEQDLLALKRRQQREAEQRKKDSLAERANNQEDTAPEAVQKGSAKPETPVKTEETEAAEPEEEAVEQPKENEEKPARGRFEVGGRKLNYMAYPRAKKSKAEEEPVAQKPSKTAEKSDEVRSEEKQETPPETTAKKEVKAQPPVREVPVETSTPQTKQWKVVLASFDDEQQAQQFIAKRGINAEIIYVPKVGNYRVAVGGFANLREAQISLNELSNTYADAWIAQF